jgi:hypothetical protein
MNALRACLLSPLRDRSAPEERKRVGKKQHTPIKKRNYFPCFFAFAPLRLLQNAGILLAWHACLGPAPLLFPFIAARRLNAAYRAA